MQVLRFEDQPSACLPVSFAPWDPQLLIFAEAVHRVYITGSRLCRARCAEYLVLFWSWVLSSFWKLMQSRLHVEHDGVLQIITCACCACYAWCA